MVIKKIEKNKLVFVFGIILLLLSQLKTNRNFNERKLAKRLFGAYQFLLLITIDYNYFILLYYR